eukprot:scaffold91002_cov30-Tisochrysis_lutea.AAC.1
MLLDEASYLEEGWEQFPLVCDRVDGGFERSTEQGCLDLIILAVQRRLRLSTQRLGHHEGRQRGSADGGRRQHARALPPSPFPPSPPSPPISQILLLFSTLELSSTLDYSTCTYSRE